MATLDSWDTWLNDQGSQKQGGNAALDLSVHGQASVATKAPEPVNPLQNLNENGKKEVAEIAAAVDAAAKVAQLGAKYGKKGRKRRLKDLSGSAEKVYSESFEAVKQRILSQTFEPEPAPEQESNEGGGGGDKGTDGMSKSKAKRQKRKAAAAKKQRLKMNAGQRDPSHSTQNETEAAAATAGAAVNSVDNSNDTKSDANAKESMTETAEKYLELWKIQHKNKKKKKAKQENGNGGGWKFKKSVQIWLLRNAYYKSRLPKKSFKHFLEYLGGLRGKAAQTTLAQVESLRKRYAAAAEAGDNSDAAKLLLGKDVQSAPEDKPSKVVGRADKTIVVLQKICDAQNSKLRLQDQ